MCNNRRLTRDLLLEYDFNIMPPRPRAAGLGVVYPWESMGLSTFTRTLYLVAAKSGFTGTEKQFYESFGAFLEDKQIIFEAYENFPEEGNQTTLYFDLNENTMYCWSNNEYVPINALLIDGTILHGGTSTELVD